LRWSLPNGGYSSVNVTEERQAQYLTREWLSNLAEGIRLSIWYDWHDDGTDPKEGEHHFGTVRYDYTPKPAFLAAQALTQSLRGFAFVKRLPPASDNDYLLLFADGPVVKLAAWTTGDGHAVVVHSGLPLPLSHWGGADDGQVHFPVQIDTLFLLDSLAGAHRSQGAVSLAQPYGIYEGEANSLMPPATR